MHTIRFGGRGGRPWDLVESADLVAVRTENRLPVEECPLSRNARDVVAAMRRVVHLPVAGVEVFRVAAEGAKKAARDRARRVLKPEPDVRFVGRVLVARGSRRPVLYTENFFVKFRADAAASACRRTIARHGLAVARELDYAENGFFVRAPEGTGLEVFRIAERLLEDPAVELAHPETVREVARKGAFPQQWHLRRATIGGTSIVAHANVVKAWADSEGRGVTIAVIDDGVATTHEELASPSKVVAPYDFTRRVTDASPGPGDAHGMACAGVACADGRHGASGVAPRARLMPIRLASGLGSQDEADAFHWAAKKRADVISCSWGPLDGDWWDPRDPAHLHEEPLPDSTRLAIDWAVTKGRGGKGCVVLFAAGNGNESVDLDGYARNEKVISVAASNDRSKRSAYSDHGDAVWCAFPSDDLVPGTRTPGIWTTDRPGPSGYNPGQLTKGDRAGHYTNSFGGTSSACPGVAGVVALMLSKNPSLGWRQVKDVLRRACKRIDARKGKYDADGHSPYYGYGRVDAARAVALA